MENNFIIAGFGGQGVLLAGEVLANAFMLDNINVTWYPSYGAEMRGGTVNCEIVMNDAEDVSSVNKAETDYIVALNQASFDRFLSKVKKGGWMIANSTLVKQLKPRADINYIFALDIVIPPHRKSLLPLNIKALKIGYEYDLSLTNV